MELYPVRRSYGFRELIWEIREKWRRHRAANWIPVTGTVEGYELLSSGDSGWFVIFYSYSVEGKQYSGECRKLIQWSFSSHENATARIIDYLPRGAKIAVHVNPNSPAISLANL